MRASVAFEFPIDLLEGKASVSQNRDAVDQAGQSRRGAAAPAIHLQSTSERCELSSTGRGT